jgi:hypothetical protein
MCPALSVASRSPFSSPNRYMVRLNSLVSPGKQKAAAGFNRNKNEGCVLSWLQFGAAFARRAKTLVVRELTTIAPPIFEFLLHSQLFKRTRSGPENRRRALVDSVPLVDSYRLGNVMSMVLAGDWSWVSRWGGDLEILFACAQTAKAARFLFVHCQAHREPRKPAKALGCQRSQV